MCGITGFFNSSKQTTRDTLLRQVTSMADAIRHRGPDDSGMYVDEQQGIALGFRRLAILDLSPTGHQPMYSADDRYVIVFNGEIYNYVELRTDLIRAGHVFRGTSDTEVILAGVLEWGLVEAVSRLNGMFSIALWDRREKRLHLIRDRVGIKPLYYGWCGDVFLFGSELKALRAHSSFDAEIDRASLPLYFRLDYIPAPYSIYQKIRKLMPGTILTVDAGKHRDEGRVMTYWSLQHAVDQGKQKPFIGSQEDAVYSFEALLMASIKDRMIADVPLGAFLSGGIDSSTVVAIMQAQSSHPIKTFTIGFEENEYNETEYARAVANHLGTEHTELYVPYRDAMNVIPQLPDLFDEPFGDSSQIPTYLVSKLARQYVTVSLSGDGGDELFGGYTRYFRSQKVWNGIKWVPRSLRALAAGLFDKFSNTRWGSTSDSYRIATRFFYASMVLGAKTSDDLYQHLTSHWVESDAIVSQKDRHVLSLETPIQLDFPHRMMYLDFLTYLSDDILTKVDRASMGASLEARAPFIDDHRVVEFAWSLPLNMKMRNGKGKWILRQVLHRHIPRGMVERPKMGFGLPIDSWLRGPMKDWAETLLDEKRIHDDGFINPLPVREKWREHLSYQKNWQYYLWPVLMFQAWLEKTRQA